MPTMPTFLPGPVFQWRSGDQVVMPAQSSFFVMVHGQNEILVHRNGGGITAIGVGTAADRAVIGAGEADRAIAILLQPVLAGGAGAAAIHHAADADDLAGLEFLHIAADGGDLADYFVAGHGGKLHTMPFAARGMQVGMADAAIQNFQRHVLGARRTAVNGIGRQRRGGRLGGISFGLHEISLKKGGEYQGLTLGIYEPRKPSPL
jgi:hypothetical protein